MRPSHSRQEGLPSRLQLLADLLGSVSALAETAGVSRRSLTDWLQGLREPQAAFLHRIADKTGVDYQWIREGQGEMPAKLLVNRPAPETVALTPISAPQVRSITHVDRNWASLRLGVSPDKIILWNQPDDSMEPMVGLGDPVLCRAWPTENPPPIVGFARHCIVVVRNEYLLRTVVQTEGVGPILLRPCNPKYAEMTAPEDLRFVAEALWGGHSLVQPKNEIRTKKRGLR